MAFTPGGNTEKVAEAVVGHSAPEPWVQVIDKSYVAVLAKGREGVKQSPPARLNPLKPVSVDIEKLVLRDREMRNLLVLQVKQ